MSETANLVDAIRRIHHGDAWHGLSLKEILTDVTFELATARPVSGTHSIWELVLHIAAWEETFAQRLKGVQMDSPSDGDFPSLELTGEENWEQARKRLDAAHEGLLQTVSNLKDSDLSQIVPGKDYSVAFMLHGLIRHHVYHAGQIGLLKKAITSALGAITSGQ